jgi:hypothetical protein
MAHNTRFWMQHRSPGMNKAQIRAQWIAGGLALALVTMALIGSARGRMCVYTQEVKAIANCRQVIIAIRLFAADHGGNYPDSKVPSARDSNTVFRQLFISGAIEDEKIFGCRTGPFDVDGELGITSDFEWALEAGENHWAMTKGLDDAAAGGIPLIYENPAEASWPPKWNSDAAGQPVKGRAWGSGKIVVGMNDTSVELMNLASRKGTCVPLKSLPNGGNPFERHTRHPDGRPYEILDVATK